jgi:V8-like Glu-specific endopeptidase
MEARHARNQVLRALTAGCALFVLAAAGGCSGSVPRTPEATPAGKEGEGRPVHPLHYEGVAQRDAVVRVVGKGKLSCTGTLFADDRVLTAHHCVSERDAKGRVLNRDMSPDDIQVELGGDDFPWGDVKVRAVVTPQCGFVSGDGDIAILVLERHLIGMPTSTARIEAVPQLKDLISVFGFGRCALSHRGIHRTPREPVEIGSVAPGSFQAEASICPGDSGGPVYNSKMELIGVVSASVMDGDEQTKGRSIFTRVDVWRQLFAAAHEISLGASPSELPPYGECQAPAPRTSARP